MHTHEPTHILDTWRQQPHRLLCSCAMEAHSCLDMENAAGAWAFSAGQAAPSPGVPPAEAEELSCSLCPPCECKAQSATAFGSTHFLLEENLKWFRGRVQRWLGGKMPYSRISFPLQFFLPSRAVFHQLAQPTRKRQRETGNPNCQKRLWRRRVTQIFGRNWAQPGKWKHSQCHRDSRERW